VIQLCATRPCAGAHAADGGTGVIALLAPGKVGEISLEITDSRDVWAVTSAGVKFGLNTKKIAVVAKKD
jgi:hypothetical protein